MGEVPGWLREQVRIEGWVVVESIETFDVHLGQRYANRALALQKALAGDALLSSRGKAATSADLNAFLIGRLGRSAEPIVTGPDAGLFYLLDSVERHEKPRRPVVRPPVTTAPRASEPWSWTCPRCKESWLLPADEPLLSEDPARCPECAEPPSEFTPGQIVRVRSAPGLPSRLGVIDKAIQTDTLDPESGELSVDDGPYVGDYMVLHLKESPGGRSADLERHVFSSFPREPERRRDLASFFMDGTSARPDEIQALDPDEARQLLQGA